MTTHTEQVKTPGSALSPMQFRLLLMPERAQQRSGRLSRKQRQLNAPPHLQPSQRICPPVPPIPPIPRPTRCLIQCTRLRCIHRHTSLSLNPPIHSLHICSITLVHSQLLRPIHPCFRLTNFPL